MQDDPGEPWVMVQEARYDGLNRRIFKIVRKVQGENVTYDRTDYYYNESWQCLEERTGSHASLGEYPPSASGARGTVATAVKVQWLWDIRYIDAPVLRWRDTGGDPDLDETLYYCNDANMNVTALVNTDGTVVERVAYDPYGKPKFYNVSWTNPSDTSAYANEILYCGYRFDPETGLYHVRHRYYHPTLGRFVQRDPLGEDGRGLYEYGGGSPVSSLDPTGKEAERCCCLSVKVTFEKGSRLTVYGANKVGFPITVQFTVVGNVEKCKYIQDEKGSITADGPKASAKTTLELPDGTSRVVEPGRSFGPRTITGHAGNQIKGRGKGAGNTYTFTDEMGFDYPDKGREAMSVTLRDFEATFRCEGTDGSKAETKIGPFNQQVTASRPASKGRVTLTTAP